MAHLEDDTMNGGALDFSRAVRDTEYLIDLDPAVNINCICECGNGYITSNPSIHSRCSSCIVGDKSFYRSDEFGALLNQERDMSKADIIKDLCQAQVDMAEKSIRDSMACDIWHDIGVPVPGCKDCVEKFYGRLPLFKKLLMFFRALPMVIRTAWLHYIT